VGASAANDTETNLARSFVSVAALVVLFSVAPIWESIHLTALANTDLWWHLRTGLWILQNRALPHSGLFSQSGALPWSDTSWAFDAVLGAAYKLFGLRALVILSMGFRLAFAAIAYMLARKSGARFWPAVLLSAVAQFVVPSLQPGPSSMSVLFFAIELILIARARISGELHPLLWLPLMFAVWANFDVQVVSGLVLLVLFLLASAGENAVRRSQITFLRMRRSPLPMKYIGAVLGASALCTLANPYTYHVFFEYGRTLYSIAGFRYFAEMHAMAFRSSQEYLLMLLIMTAYLALARRRSLAILELALLIASTLLAFRIQRDAWIAVLASVTIIAAGFADEETDVDEPESNWQKPLIPVLTGVIFLLAAWRIPDEGSLLGKIGQNYPVKACNFIVSHHLSPPVFNSYSWGGFLTWYLPDYPVFIDGRMELYRDEDVDRYFDLISGKGRLESDPAFASAQTILLEQKSGMAKALINIPQLSAQYQLAYSDDVAEVFVRE